MYEDNYNRRTPERMKTMESKSGKKIVMDVWGGEYSTDHVARFIVDKEEAFRLSSIELDNGFLVNLRTDLVWGNHENFDLRKNKLN